MATNPFQYPFGVPSVSGNSITIDLMLNEPTRITRYLADLSLRNMFSQEVFSTPGGVEGGALLYDVLTANDLFLDSTREVQNVEPGAEFPVVTTSRSAPSVALVEKFGGKFFITDEARGATTSRRSATSRCEAVEQHRQGRGHSRHHRAGCRGLHLLAYRNGRELVDTALHGRFVADEEPGARHRLRRCSAHR
jgi:hypothetical protein